MKVKVNFFIIIYILSTFLIVTCIYITTYNTFKSYVVMMYLFLCHFKSFICNTLSIKGKLIRFYEKVASSSTSIIVNAFTFNTTFINRKIIVLTITILREEYYII